MTMDNISFSLPPLLLLIIIIIILTIIIINIILFSFLFFSDWTLALASNTSISKFFKTCLLVTDKSCRNGNVSECYVNNLAHNYKNRYQELRIIIPIGSLIGYITLNQFRSVWDEYLMIQAITCSDIILQKLMFSQIGLYNSKLIRSFFWQVRAA